MSTAKAVAPTKAILDAAVQTTNKEISDGSCQTDDLERKDFQAQAHFEKQNESIATQTESTEKCDCEVQANIQQESESLPLLVPAPTIKQEFAMPNIPSSIAQTPAKKRKLSTILSSSAVATNLASIDVSLSIEPSGSGVLTGDPISNALVEISKNSPPVKHMFVFSGLTAKNKAKCMKIVKERVINVARSFVLTCKTLKCSTHIRI